MLEECNLIDGEARIERFEELRLGLVAKTIYEIDSFFSEDVFPIAAMCSFE